MTHTTSIQINHGRKLTVAALLVVSFALSRLIFWHIGVRFDSSSLGWFWQYLDLPVLRHDLLSGIFHMHSQPPGFNLFLGVVLKCFPGSSDIWFRAAYMFSGFILYCFMYLLLRQFAFSVPLAFVCSFIYIISPGAILYENWLFYTYPISIFLIAASIALQRAHAKGHPLYAAAFLFAIAAVCLTRSAFHLLFFLICAGLILILRDFRNRKVMGCAFAILCLIGTLYIKNYALFGFFGASSWIGMNVFKIAEQAVGTNTVNELVQSGSIPTVAAHAPFSALDTYPQTEPLQRIQPRHVALTTTTKTSGSPNYNHLDYVTISKDYGRASSFIIRNNPRLYLGAVFDAWCLYCNPSWQYGFLKANNQAISGWLSFLTYFRSRGWIDLRPFKRWAFGSDGGEIDLYPVTSLLFLPSILLLACAGTVARISRFVRKGDSSGLVFVFMTFTVMYVAVLGNALEYGENNRFRVETDPLIFLLGAIIMRDIWLHVSRRLLRKHANKSVDHYVSPAADGV